MNSSGDRGPKLEATQRWFGAKAKSFTGRLEQLLSLLPRFQLVPVSSFLFMIRDPSEGGDAVRMRNPNRLVVVRIPMQTESPIAVAMVSQKYLLVQHSDLVEALIGAMDARDLELRPLEAKLLLSQFGERMYLEIDLGHRRDCLERGPGKAQLFDQDATPAAAPKSLSLSLHLFNSVDTSLSLGLRLGWYSKLTMSGFYLGVERENLRKVHSSDLGDIHLPTLLDELVSGIPGQARLIADYMKTHVSLQELTSWVDNDVVGMWGVSEAARVQSIARTGWDGLVDLAKKDLKAHERPVVPRTEVLKRTSATVYAYDVLQALGWVAGHDPVIERRMRRSNQVKGLVDELLLGKKPGK